VLLSNWYESCQIMRQNTYHIFWFYFSWFSPLHECEQGYKTKNKTICKTNKFTLNVHSLLHGTVVFKLYRDFQFSKINKYQFVHYDLPIWRCHFEFNIIYDIVVELNPIKDWRNQFFINLHIITFCVTPNIWTV